MRDGGKAATQNASNDILTEFFMFGSTCIVDSKMNRNLAQKASHW